jgi:hypothetical protein
MALVSGSNPASLLPERVLGVADPKRVPTTLFGCILLEDLSGVVLSRAAVPVVRAQA